MNYERGESKLAKAVKDEDLIKKLEKEEEEYKPRKRINLRQLAKMLLELQPKIGFKVSSRGWCYQLEGFGMITKGEFDRIQRAINICRKRGYIPIDFVLVDETRVFDGVETPEEKSPSEMLKSYIRAVMQAEEYYTPDWWEGEEYYIQMMVEKIDLRTLFTPVCKMFHIPIATARGWSDINQRARMAWRFRDAEKLGLKPVLMYCGDHDPWGLEISDKLKKNLWDIYRGTGWNPHRLIVDRFGLNYDFIMENDLTWIENLESSSGKPPDMYNPIVIRYVRKYGIKKVEANALVVRPEQGRELCRKAVEKYLGEDAVDRFIAKKDEIREKFDELREETGVQEALEKALDTLE